VTALSHNAFPVPEIILSPQQRAQREKATKALLERRMCSIDESERQRLLEQVVELNADVAHSIASRYRNRGVDLEDLQQAACLGLLGAAHRYRPELDIPFLGFAIPTIRGEIKRYFRDYAWTIRIPRRLQELQRLIATRSAQLKQELGRQPTSDEIANHLQVDVTQVEEAMAARGYFSTLSLDQPIGTAGQLLLGDVVAGGEDQALLRFEQVSQLQPALDDLPSRERRILELRFVEGWSQAAIGADIGVSQMQISRILGRILDDLRDRLLAA
jgi:RNA polymerase sigma-B factor